IAEPAPATGGTSKVARLKYEGNWDPEPFAWKRFSRWFTRETSCAVNVSEVDLAALEAKSVSFAHLTGCGACTPTEAQAVALRRFVEGGGVVLIDSTGGSASFAASATQLLAKAFGDGTLRSGQFIRCPRRRPQQRILQHRFSIRRRIPHDPP